MIKNEPLASILKELKKNANTKTLKGLAKYGINTEKALGIPIPLLREIAKNHKNNHQLALDLWNTKFHEARILASLIDDPKLVTNKQVEAWIVEFNSWDLCDQCCANLFEDTSFAYEKAVEWSKRNEEYIKRAGFVMMARLAISDKKAEDTKFDSFLQRIKEESMDERNFVKKAVNWALRQIGKRSMHMNQVAIFVAKEMLQLNSKAAKWIANDALRELTSPNIIKRIKKN